MLKPLRGIPLNVTHPLARGLVACWLMNEGTGNKIFDYSRNWYAGTLTNMALPGAWDSGGLNFDGSNDFVTMGDVLDIGLSDWTVAVCFKTDILKFASLVSKNPTGSAQGWFFAMNQVDFEGKLGIGIDGLYQYMAFDYADNKPHLLVGVWDRSANAEIFADGQSLGTLDISSKSAVDVQTSVSTCIACRDDVSAFFRGRIFYVFIWKRILFASEVRQLYWNPYAMFEYPNAFFSFPLLTILDLFHPQIKNLKQSYQINSLKQKNRINSEKQENKIKWQQ